MTTIDFITNRWQELMQQYSARESTNQLLDKLIKEYTSKKRHYHNLQHIENLLKLSEEFKDDLGDKQSIDFSILFHDVVYKSTASSNEEESAVYAKSNLLPLNVPQVVVDKVYHYIIATKLHNEEPEMDEDLKWFLDFDLSVLASSEENYQIYMKEIRKEYSIFPDLLYKPGRRKVLGKLLEREFIYKTEYFRTRHENKARENILFEISALS